MLLLFKCKTGYAKTDLFFGRLLVTFEMLRLSTQSISWINSDINSSIVVKRVKTYSWSETTEKNTLTERTSYLYHQFNGFCSCSHTLALIPNVGRKNLSAEIQVWEKSTAFRKYARENPSQRTMTSNICKFSRHFYPEKGWKNGIAFFLYSLHFNWMQATHKQFIIYSNDYGIFSITRKKNSQTSCVLCKCHVIESNESEKWLCENICRRREKSWQQAIRWFQFTIEPLNTNKWIWHRNQNHSHAFKLLGNLHRKPFTVNFRMGSRWIRFEINDVFDMILMIAFGIAVKQIERKLLTNSSGTERVNWICTTSIVYVNKYWY